MRFVLLGTHPQARRVWSALNAVTEHTIAAIVVPSALTDRLTASAIATQADVSAAELIAAYPGARVSSEWEEVLDDRSWDVAIIAGSDELTQTGAKQIAMDGRPVCLIPTAAQGSAFIYELSLIQDDNRVPLIPLIPVLCSDLIEQLRTITSDGTLGALVLLRLERTIAPDSVGGLLSRVTLDAALLDDVLVLRAIGGHYSRITAIHSGATEVAVSMATVTLAGDGTPEATVITHCGAASWKLVVTGAQGEAELTLDPMTQVGRLVVRSAAGSQEFSTTDDQSSARLVRQQLEQGLAQSAALWKELTCGFETVEATRASLRRRRTIDLVFESTSERSIFKSHMTALGCGLLIMTFFGLVAFLLLGAFVDSKSMTQRTAEAAGRIVQETEFSGTELNPSGRSHLLELSRVLDRSPGAVFVLPNSVVPDGDAARLQAVRDEFRRNGHPEAAALVEIAKAPNQWSQRLLELLRILWIAPLALFLGLQTLLWVTRPSSRG